MLSKYEPVVLAILALGASILMENHHRIDMTANAAPAVTRAAPRLVPARCQGGSDRPTFSISSAFAAEGQAALLALGNLDEPTEACPESTGAADEPSRD